MRAEARRGAASRGPRFLLLGAVPVLLSLAVSLRSISRHFEGGVTWEFCHYGEIGRNLLETGAYRTREVTPWTLALLDARGIPFDAAHPAPVLDRFPLQAALSALAEKLGGADDAALAALSALLMAGCVAAAFAAGLIFFSAAEALTAASLLALDPSFQRGFVLWGYPDFGFLILTVLAAVVLCAENPEETSTASSVRLALAGALAGAAWLARSNFILWLPLFLWAAWRGPRGARTRGAAWFAAAFIAAAAPGWIYNLRWFGGINPPTLGWNLADRVIPGPEPWLAYRTYAVGEIVTGHAPALARKFFDLLARYLRDLPGLWQLQPAFAAAAVGAWSLFGERRARAEAPARRWTLLALGMLAGQILVFSFLRHETLGAHVGGRYLLWFAPALLLLACRGALRIGRAFGRPRAGLALFALVTVGWFARFWSQPQGGETYPGGARVADWPELRAAAALPDDGLIVTNLSTQVAWYARRPAVALPATPEDLSAIMARHRVSAVLISRLSVGELAQTPAWRPYAADPAGAARELWRRLGFRLARDYGTAALLVRLDASAR